MCNQNTAQVLVPLCHPCFKAQTAGKTRVKADDSPYPVPTRLTLDHMSCLTVVVHLPSPLAIAGVNRIGRREQAAKDSDDAPTILLKGSGVSELHAVLTLTPRPEQPDALPAVQLLSFGKNGTFVNHLAKV